MNAFNNNNNHHNDANDNTKQPRTPEHFTDWRLPLFHKILNPLEAARHWDYVGANTNKIRVLGIK